MTLLGWTVTGCWNEAQEGKRTALEDALMENVIKLHEQE